MVNKKKVLIVSMAYFPRFVGGAEVAIKEITDRLSDEYEFHLVTLRYDSTLPRESKEGNVYVHRIGFSTQAPTLSDLRKLPLHLNKYLFQFSAYLKARKLHRAHRYDMVWSMMAHSAGIPGALFKITYPRVPFLLTLQEGDTPEHIAHAARPSLFLFNLAFVRADAVQAISHFLAAWAKRQGAKRRVDVIPNGVDVSRFSTRQTKEEREKKRKELCSDDEATLLVTVSRLVKKNGVDLVIRALPHLPSRVTFVVAGDGPEKENLKHLAASLEVEDRVLFLGEVSQQDLPLLLSSCDMFIRASRSEGQGIAFIEAMAMGLPTIGTNVGGIPDFLRESETGFLAEPTSESIASAVVRAIEHPIETNRVAEGGQRLVKEKYDWNGIATEMGSLFKTLT